MGTYLSTPVKDKCAESGESLHCPVVPVAWGVVDMQGWRKSMEDAHVAVTDVPHPSSLDANKTTNEDAKVFGVFDGHGGPEVARFCALYLVSVLQQQPTWSNSSNSSSNDAINTESIDMKDDMHEEADSNKENAKHTSIGKALVTAFHALDRMIDDPSRRDELVRLRAIKPIQGAQKQAETIPPEIPLAAAMTLADDTNDNVEKTDAINNEANVNKEKQHDEDSPVEEADANAMMVDHVVDHVPDDETFQQQLQQQEEGQMNDNEQPQNEDKDEQNSSDTRSEDTDSDVAVGKEEAAELDQDMMSDEDDNDVIEEINTSSNDTNDATGENADGTTSVKVSSMFQRLLNMNVTGAAGQAVLSLSSPSKQQQPKDGTTPDNASEPFRASLVQNGRMICNLPDHPIHAGATAIVAVIVGRTLTVANAGDSRAVLCRDGAAVALSFDHKPIQERELNRIIKAGGFVNTFGRVNGNLNLSRSLGDLKYKQVPGIPPAEQMITAEPDVLQYELGSGDEFIILGCDGIWDCLTNEQAVDYVRSRIMRKTPTEIGIEMLDEIISVDPRITQGIGGDNMTIMIVDLQPHSRSYRQSAMREENREETPVEED